ncbi:MAG: beta-lactamase family protein, partial [Clostridia bacterium]|nr:beta-lactamase family protein [Clostridia bacterium]
MQKLREQIAAYCRENGIGGMLRITIKDQIVYEQTVGFANAADKTPFTKDSIFTLYSLSKPFCAIGLLKLKDKGLVDLDRHPAVYVPEAQGFDERVTVRHLLHHISGLPDFAQTAGFAEKYAPGYSKCAREHLKALTKYPSFFAPATDAKYANVNFVLCALIIESVTGVPYPKYMEREVFAPLGMHRAVVDNEELVIPHRVSGHELVGEVLTPVRPCYDWLYGAGDIVATVEDVYCLNKAIKHHLLLSESTWEEVLAPSPLNHMGMGCTVTTWHGKQRITHNGGHKGFRTLHVQLPQDDFDIIFLSNSG